MSREANDYRAGVGIVLLNQHNFIFIGQRFEGSSEAWQMPQGGIDEGETPRQAAFRELQEEVGTHRAEILFELDEWLYYDIPTPIAARLWGGRYKGQRQKWFVFRFLGTDTDINIATAHPEFRAWRWEDPSLITNLAIGFRRESYRRLFSQLKDHHIFE